MLQILPLLLAVAAPPEVVVLPVIGTGDTEQQLALQRVAASAIERNAKAHSTLEVTKPGTFDEACRDAACLSQHGTGKRRVVSVEVVPFGQSSSVTIYEWDASMPETVHTSTRTASNPDEVPKKIEELVDDLWPRAPVPSVSAIAKDTDKPKDPGEWSPTIALNPKGSGLLPAFTGSRLQFTGLSPRLDLEIDYFALPNFTPFIDASLVFGGSTSGQSINLVPVLLGAKYIFRSADLIRPYVGLGIGVGFLTSSLNTTGSTSASFAVYSVVGLSYFPWRQVGFNLETSVNLNGLEVSASSGILFAISGSLGVIFVF